MRDFAVALAAGLLISSVSVAPAFAQAPSSGQQSAKPAKDPNEIICQKEEDTGSRLSSHRICKTRAEWAADRLTQRQEIERVQVQRGCPTSGC